MPHRWFESEILKTTLATDAVVGALVSLKQNGSAYVLLHHVMGEAGGKKGVWSYVEGGMGSISNAIAQSATDKGAEIVLNATVKKILWEKDRVTGVEMMDGSQLFSDVVVAGCNPYHTFMELLPGLALQSGSHTALPTPLPLDFIQHLRFSDYSCGAFKINCAVNSLPNFSCYPSDPNGQPGPQHKGTIHFECTMEEIENCYREASMGIPSSRPVIEMTIPSSVDPTLVTETGTETGTGTGGERKGHHVVQLFIQFVPYDLDPKIGNWNDMKFKNQYADRIFEIIELYCPGFIASVVGRDVLSPLDLERVFGLQKGQICHGSLSLHQLGYARPMTGYAQHRTPLKGLYLCSAGAHPGGGVMGAPGKNCAEMILRDR
jgi:phytoene dehydrogenase-like protein